MLDKDKEYTLNIGGRLGYVPESDFVIMEGYASGEYKPTEKLILQAKLTLGSSSRDDSSYKYVSDLFPPIGLLILIYRKT